MYRVNTAYADDIVLTAHVDDDSTWSVSFVGDRWPERALFSAQVLRQCPGPVALHYPWITLRVDNGHAVYRVDTCDRGLWTGTLVEGWVQPR